MTSKDQPLLARGSTWHQRKAPRHNAFKYSVYFLLLPLRAMRAEPSVRYQWGALSFAASDHGRGGPDALAWVEELLDTADIDTRGAEIWLQTFPRVMGYVFKPVSIWYVVREGGSLAAAVVEVNNTFGQRHIYLLSGDGVGWGQTLQAEKVFHVSPFCDVQGLYQFKFTKTTDYIAAHIQNEDLQTYWVGRTEPLTRSSARRAFLSSPLMTFGIVVRIHWQAAKLWWKKTPFYRLPAKPAQFVTHGQIKPNPATPNPKL